jgi:outer membrane murein-binding lipoprotein Lpp
MSNVASLSAAVEELRQDVDEILSDLAGASQLLERIKQQFDELPFDENTLSDISKECGDIASSIQAAAAAWEELPTIDDVNEYAKAVSAVKPRR